MVVGDVEEQPFVWTLIEALAERIPVGPTACSETVYAVLQVRPKKVLLVPVRPTEAAPLREAAYEAAPGTAVHPKVKLVSDADSS